LQLLTDWGEAVGHETLRTLVGKYCQTMSMAVHNTDQDQPIYSPPPAPPPNTALIPDP